MRDATEGREIGFVGRLGNLQRDCVGHDPCPEWPFKTPIVTFMKKAAGVEVDKWLTITGTQFESYLGHISIARQETSVQPPKVR